MFRSKELFLKVFEHLKPQFYDKMFTFNFIKANTDGISKYFFKRASIIFLKRFERAIIKEDHKQELEKSINSLERIADKGWLLSKKYGFNYVATLLILAELKIRNINRYVDLLNYMFSLPVYKELYTKEKPKYNLDLSPYVFFINRRLKQT